MAALDGLAATLGCIVMLLAELEVEIVVLVLDAPTIPAYGLNSVTLTLESMHGRHEAVG